MRKFDFAAGGWKYVSGYKMLIGKNGSEWRSEIPEYFKKNGNFK